MSSATDTKFELASKFNNNILMIFKFVQKRSPKNNDLIRCRRIFNLGRNTNICSIIDECHDNFWKYRKEIRNNCYDFMDDPETIEYTQQSQFNFKEYAKMIKNLTDYLNAEKHFLNDEDKLYIYGILNNTLDVVADYRALILHGYDFYKEYLLNKNKAT